MRESFAEMMELNKTIDAEIPKTVKTSSAEIGEIDRKVTKMSADARKMVYSYLKNLKSFNKSQRVQMYQEIQKVYAEIEKLADKKVKLAQEAYDKIDDSITAMDRINDKMAEEFKSKKVENAKKEVKNETPSRKASTSRKRKSTTIPDAKAAKFAESESFANEIQEITPQIYGQMDMPVNPFEPVYCICKKVSSGRMIGCDNSECEDEWFHFICLGITEEPKGVWYCAKCEPLMQKQKKK
ncbi:unnamed protein product [Caenorhabditis angaria]|uniref:Inhibitor of growth protein n=1 Tax=Caenorhabditis angaria TaxID=860376 RepID=A0A9P1IMJ7_9PELO|nr:unnamed protein product [Caenorhabditis angaria]